MTDTAMAAEIEILRQQVKDLEVERDKWELSARGFMREKGECNKDWIDLNAKLAALKQAQSKPVAYRFRSDVEHANGVDKNRRCLSFDPPTVIGEDGALLAWDVDQLFTAAPTIPGGYVLVRRR